MHLPNTLVTIAAVVGLFITNAVAQQKVVVRFGSCGALVDATGTYQSDGTSSEHVFSNVSVRGDCGAVLYKFRQGELLRSELSAGDICLVRGTLKARGGATVADALVRVRNDKGRMVARGRTDTKGKVSFRFRNRTATTRYYVLVGPRDNDLSTRVGCYFYQNQRNCNLIDSVGAQAC